MGVCVCVRERERERERHRDDKKRDISHHYQSQPEKKDGGTNSFFSFEDNFSPIFNFVGKGQLSEKVFRLRFQ